MEGSRAEVERVRLQTRAENPQSPRRPRHDLPARTARRQPLGRLEVARAEGEAIRLRTDLKLGLPGERIAPSDDRAGAVGIRSETAKRRSRSFSIGPAA